MPGPGESQRAASKFVVFDAFEKLNTASVRQSLSEKEFSWLENLQPIAPNNLVTIPAPAQAALVSIGETILSLYYANLGTIDYMIVFTTAGSGWAINLATGVAVEFAPDGTFTDPDATTWESKYVLINDIKSGYSFWDGTTFTQQGGVSPNIFISNEGSGYTSVPTVTISGGSGSGATAVATIGTPDVTGLTITNPGSGYSSVPAVGISGGGGTGATAIATISPEGLETISLVAPNYGGICGIIPPTPVFTGTGIGAAATCTVTPAGLVYTVNSITITNPGTGYTSPPTITFTGTGITQAPTATCTVDAGTVIALTITSPGSGYTSAPAVTIAAPGGGGTTATATSSIGGSGVLTITLTNPGSGYLASDVLTVTIGPPNVSSSVTFTNSSATIGWTGAGSILADGVMVYFTTTGAMPGGFTANTVYYVVNVATNSIQVSATPGGTAITASTAGTSPWTGHVGEQATATAHVSPFIPKGSTIAVFQGRVWLGGGKLLQYTGTQGFDDFDADNASGSLTIPDADLVHAIMALRSYNNYLYIMGDQSVKQIGNISLDSTGLITIFTILTLSSDQGTIWKRSCASFNRIFTFANPNGIFAVLGSSVQKISDDLDGLFRMLDFSQPPQAALADILNRHQLLYLVRYIDPVVGTRSIMLSFDGKKWYIISQGNGIVVIENAPLLSTGKQNTWASLTGTDLTQIFASPTVPVSFKAQTSLTPHGNPIQRKKILAGGIAVTLATGTGTITVLYETDNGSLSLNYALTAGFQAPGGASGVEGSGKYLGMTITGTLSGFTFTNAAIEYQETSLWGKP